MHPTLSFRLVLVSLLLSLFLPLSGVPAAAQLLTPEPPVLDNLGFEDGTPGTTPDGWFVPEKVLDLGFNAETVDDQAAEGTQSAMLFLEAEEPPLRGFANLMRRFDATAYRGKRVRFSAQVRTEPEGYKGRAQMWMRVDLDPGGGGFFDNMDDRPITSGEWTRYEIVGDIESNAGMLNIGVMQFGDGRTWIDDVRVEILGDAGEGASPPAAISERGIDNVAAFARLYGVVRYFHPSDQATRADWHGVAMGGAAAVEDLETPEELAAALEDYLRPIAPTLRVHAGEQADEQADEPTDEIGAALDPPTTEGLVRTGYWHFGVEMDPKSIYKSRRIESGGLPDTGGLSRQVSGEGLQGRKVRFSASVRAEPEAGTVHLFAVPLTEGFDPSFGVQIAENEALKVDGTWGEHHVDLDVPQEAGSFILGIAFEPSADGAAVFLDDLRLHTLTDDGEIEEEIALFGGDFEDGLVDNKPDGWNVEGDAVSKGFYADLQEEIVHEGEGAVRLWWRDPVRDLADPAEPYRLDLGRGVVAHVPIALWKSVDGTLPTATEPPPGNGKPAGFRPVIGDRLSRLGWVIQSWNSLHHFYPYFDVTPGDWHGALRDALRSAALDEDAADFQATLQRMMRELHDGHGGVYGPFPYTHRVPLLWSWIEDRLVVTVVDASIADRVAPGDVVLRIDGRSAAEALEELERGISSATPQWRRFRSTTLLGNGVHEQEFELLVRTGDDEPRLVTLRATGALRGEEALQEKRPEKIAEIEPGIFYLDLDRVSTEEFNAEVERLAEADGLIFDLRGYPRNISPVVLAHLIDEPITSARWEVPIVTRPEREGLRFHISNWTVEPKAPRLHGAAVFLTDGRAISYAETYLGMVEHYKLAEIVGSPTAGTNGNINPTDLGAARMRLIWTGMRVRKHDGTRHHGVGIRPTLPVVRTVEGTAAGRDEVLERALEWIESRIEERTETE